MQASLFQGKCAGLTRLEGLGPLTWKEMVALTDVLISMVSTEMTSAQKRRLRARLRFEVQDKPHYGNHIPGDRHDSLQLLAWLTEGWPNSQGAAIGSDMLERWLSGQSPRSCSSGLYSSDPDIRRRLWQILSPLPATL